MSILEILEDHRQHDAVAKDTRFYCLCGWVSGMPRYGYGPAEHRTHVAQVLEQHEREAKAAVLTDVAANLARESDQFATTADRLTGHDNTRYHAYSAARQSIAHQLRDRAAQLKETP